MINASTATHALPRPNGGADIRRTFTSTQRIMVPISDNGSSHRLRAATAANDAVVATMRTTFTPPSVVKQA